MAKAKIGINKQAVCYNDLFVSLFDGQLLDIMWGPEWLCGMKLPKYSWIHQVFTTNKPQPKRTYEELSKSIRHLPGMTWKSDTKDRPQERTN